MIFLSLASYADDLYYHSADNLVGSTNMLLIDIVCKSKSSHESWSLVTQCLHIFST